MVTKERIKKLYSDHGTLIIFLAAVVAFLPSLKNGFAFDDLIHVQENPSIRTWNAAFNLFIEPTYPGDLFRPLTNFSYALKYLFIGLQKSSF